MKLKHILTSIVAAAFVFAGCEDQIEISTLEGVEISNSVVGFVTEGGTKTISLTSDQAWSVDEKSVPSWISVTPLSGNAGETIISFTAVANTGAQKSAELIISFANDKKQIIKLQQDGGEPSPSTCKDVIAGDDGVSFKVTGAITSIENTHYGNFHMDDGTGEIYIYGTLDKKGNANSSSNSYDNLNDPNYASSWDLSVGDVITVQGPKKTYNETVELVDVTVVNIVKSLISVESVDYGVDADEVALEALPLEGGEVVVTLANKGEGITVSVPSDAQSWLPISAISTGTTTVVKFSVPANEGGDRDATVTFKTVAGGKEYSAEAKISQKGAIKEVSCADFNAAPVGTAKYRITGIVTKVANTTFGNYYIKDATGEVYVYGTLDLEGKTKNFASLGVEEGDIITVVGTRSEYNNAAQMPNAQYESHIDVTAATVAELLEKADDKATYYLVKGIVSEYSVDPTKTDLVNFGNFDLKDETGTIYVYGCSTGWNGTKGNGAFATLGVKLGDEITMVVYKTSYKSVPQLVGYYLSHETPEEPGDNPGDNPGGDSNVITITVDGIPTAYPTEETTVTLGGQSCLILNVANYGSGIQMKKSGSYLANATALPKNIKSIKVTCTEGKSWYPTNLTLTVGTTAKPETEVEAVSDANSSTYDVTGDATYFMIKNASSYAVYLEKIEITLAE